MTMSEGHDPAPKQGSRRRGRDRPKGRQIEPSALDDVRALLGDRPRRRDLLIEHLHLVQDARGHLSAAHLAALADEMRLPMAEVFEVATFYAHFDVVGEGEAPPPAVTVRVCDSLSCALAGAEAVHARMKSALGTEVRVLRAPCLGACDRAPAVALGHRLLPAATPEAVRTALASAPAVHRGEPAADDYGVLDACRRGAHDVEDVIATIEAAGLRGLGGAGFPTGRKWELVRRQPKPRFVALNADEGEPGTFKDRWLLEREPRRVLEGLLIAAWAVEAEAAYVYLRDEYPEARDILLAEIAALQATGWAPPGGLHLRRGAGAYICGEESAMLESIEGRRGYPRHRPPYAAEVGLFGRPTLIHNVETVAWVPPILRNGSDWFASLGRRGHKGLRTFSVSGRVREPGPKTAPAGITARELIEEHCGGMADGHRFRAYLPGGASGGILPASMADIPLDFGTLEEHGCFIGSHAVIVLSDRDDLRAAALNLMRFFEDESCGQCTPCRVGTEKAVALMREEHWDRALLEELAQNMTDASICGLGQAAPNPLLSLFRYFPEELRHAGGAP